MWKVAGFVRVVAASTLVWIAANGIAAAQSWSRVSTDAVGAQVAGASRQPSASADARFVAFVSSATTLVAGDTNGSADIFVKDRQTGAVTRASVWTGGAEFVGDSASPDVSADGRYLTFVSAAFLTADDTNASSCPGAALSGPSCPDVFRHDRITGETIRVSVSSAGVEADAASAAPRISGDGRYVVFESLATTLVDGDTNARRDIFLRDLQASTTSRVSVSTGNIQSDRDTSAPAISDDGARVSFLTDATTLDDTGDPLACDAAVLPCTRAFVRTVATGTTIRAAVTDPALYNPGAIVSQRYQVVEAAVSSDGSSLGARLYRLNDDGREQFSSVESFASYSANGGAAFWATTLDADYPAQPPTLTVVGTDPSGRFLARCIGTPDFFYLDKMDLQTGQFELRSLRQDGECADVSLSGDGLTVFFASSSSTIGVIPDRRNPGPTYDTSAAFDVFALDVDGDNDGMSVYWETHFGLNDADAADASLDVDNDGVTNRQEFAAGTHPRGLFKYYLAEGAQNSFFRTEIAVYRPVTNVPGTSDFVAQFLGQNGRRTTTPLLLAAVPLFTFSDQFSRQEPWRGLWFPLPDEAFSTVVESERPLAIERTMTWGGAMGTGYGSHAERAVSGPAATWYFAEGATHGAFDLFYLLQNPASTTATATVTYLLPAPRAPIVRAYTLLPNSRRTIYVDQEPGLGATDVSARIDADQPIFAERAMYMTSGGQPFSGGTASAGISASALQWFIAEGATGSFFDMYILIGNPSTSAAEITITYLLPNGTTVDKQHQVAAQSRLTVAVEAEDARLAETALSATITSSGTPIVVERAMWWPSPNWYEGTVTAATTTSATRWALAGGFIDPQPDTETYLLVANPGTVAANVTIAVAEDGNPGLPRACSVTVLVPAQGRHTTGLKGLCPALGANLTSRVDVAGLITSDGPPIVVERSTYWSTTDQFWAAGASTLLTPLP